MRRHGGLVHAHPDRADHPLGAPAFERGVGRTQRLLDVVVGVVQVHDVDVIEAQPFEAGGERPADAVGAEVEHDVGRLDAEEHVGVGVGARLEQATDLRRDHERGTIDRAEDPTESALRLAEAVVRRGVDVADPGTQRGEHHLRGVVLIDRLEQSAERRAAQPERTDSDVTVAEAPVVVDHADSFLSFRHPADPRIESS